MASATSADGATLAQKPDATAVVEGHATQHPDATAVVEGRITQWPDATEVVDGYTIKYPDATEVVEGCKTQLSDATAVADDYTTSGRVVERQNNESPDTNLPSLTVFWVGRDGSVDVEGQVQIEVPDEEEGLPLFTSSTKEKSTCIIKCQHIIWLY